MEIFVCIKQVPDDSVSVALNAAGAPELTGVTPIVNAFDTYALEMAARYKEANGGAVTVLSIGSEAAVTPSLRSCLAVGADHATVLSADVETDDTGIATLLADALRQSGDKLPDVVFCGSEATDTADGQVGVRLAALLDVPVVTDVVALEPAEGGLTVRQETEDGYRTIDVTCPCVLTVVKPGYDPRYPSMKSKIAARKMPIAVLTSGEALPAAKTVRVRLSEPAKRQGGVKIQEKETADSVARAMEMLIERKLV